MSMFLNRRVLDTHSYDKLLSYFYHFSAKVYHLVRAIPSLNVDFVIIVVMLSLLDRGIRLAIILE